MSNKITAWLVAMSFFWLTACHKQRAAKNTDIKSSADSVLVDSSPAASDSSITKEAETVAPVKIQEIAFDYLVAKSKFSFQSKTQDFDNTNVNIRMKKDSLIWISVTGIGFEVARGLITKDSIVFLDKFHKEYFAFNYEQLSKKYNFDLNFALLQSIIIGNLPFPQEPDAEFTKEENFYVLRQAPERLTVDNYIAGDNLKLTRLKATEVPTENTFTLDYEDFKNVKDVLFPFTSLIRLSIKSAKDQQVSQTTMRIKHSKVDLVDQNPGFPFNVPSSYTRKR
ncbi:DUF4292 domain-containing protein [Dyadobacter bucti]|uniref:DUF4292 domain-containing protein n=1 Tax=Dyadobacter bucti TaxID=2572203 RepID=UPI001107B60E|nr:DUF4292 domain-containing protein [Dyadobacter bucti]